MKYFINTPDKANIDKLIQKALDYKASPFKDNELGKGKRIGCIFMNPSIRTRISTQIAAKNLGLEVITINANSDGWLLEFEEGAVMNSNSVEHIKDAAKVFGQYFDILGVRAFPQLKDKETDYSEIVINQIVKYSGLPVISLESSTLHPLQSLADLITIKEEMTTMKKPKVVLTWAPHIKPIPHCVANSFSDWILKWQETELVITHPQGYELDDKFVNGATITYNQDEALKDADFVYVKNWSSFYDYGKVLTTESYWQLTMDKLQYTNNAKVMHCLPVRRNIELSDEVIDCEHSIITQQSANRIWSAQAVLSEILINL